MGNSGKGFTGGVGGGGGRESTGSGPSPDSPASLLYCVAMNRGPHWQVGVVAIRSSGQHTLVISS